MWDTVAGHARNKEFLERFLHAAHRPHALLFCGAPGLGKKRLALEFARTFLCLNQRGNDGCASCRLLNWDNHAVNHPDFLLLEPQEGSRNIKIEQVKELIAQAAFAPVLSTHRVAVINGADRMTDEAANGFLKLLEEPPVGWLLLLLAQRDEDMLPTLLSRVVRLRFYPLPLPLVEQELRAAGETAENAAVLARISGGAPGAALALRAQGALTLRRQALEFLRALPLDLSANDYAGRAWPGNTQRQEAMLLAELLQLALRDMLLLQAGATTGLYNCDWEQELRGLADSWHLLSLKQALLCTEDAYQALAEGSAVEMTLEALALTLDKLRKE